MSTTTLPHNLDAERSVVGGILLGGAPALHRVADLVEVGDFFHPTLAAIFSATTKLDAEGKPIDQVTVAAQMRVDESWHKMRAHGEEAYFGELLSAVVTVENLAYHARIVRDRAARRRVIETAREIAARGMGDEDDDREFVDEAERLMFNAAGTRGGLAYQPASRLVAPVITAAEARAEKKGELTGVPSGFVGIDLLTGGWQAGDLVIVAARPSMGKTSLAMNAADFAAVEHGIPVLVFSLEMSAESLMERLLCARAGIDSSRLRGGHLVSDEWVRLFKAQGALAPAPIYVDETASPRVSEIRAKALRWRSNRDEGGRLATEKEPGLALVVVDYLQLVATLQAKGKSREQEIAEVSKGLKQLAKELRCPVLALCQLSRAVEQRADKRPQLSDLRDSGSIEQDADVVAFIYRDEVYRKDTPDRGIAEVILGKQRKGAVGSVPLAFLPHLTRFENLSESRQEELALGSGERRRRQGAAPAYHPNAPGEED